MIMEGLGSTSVNMEVDPIREESGQFAENSRFELDEGNQSTASNHYMAEEKISLVKEKKT